MSQDSHIEGIITRSVGGSCCVRALSGQLCLCQMRGGLRRGGSKRGSSLPLVGDRVLISPSGDPDIPYVLEKVLERTNFLVRPPLANVRTLILTFAAADPEPDLKMLDKMLIICIDLGIRPAILFTKTDLNPEYAHMLRDIYSGAGFPCLLSAIDDKPSKDDLIEVCGNECPGAIIGFAGPSGVGKSTLVNHFCGESSMAVGQISERLRRGKHTTRHVELFEFGPMYITDTPGFTSLDLFELGIDYKSVIIGYPEIANLGRACRFDDCRHLAERDCAVKPQVGNAIDAGRYERYKEFYEFLYNNRNNYTGGSYK